ncbi:esterase/lipase family protein [Thiohalorhabdus sp. Cl-TMA]|uniref:Esterase/lipase family protein n=1 Tax=Thiohalorhabdus methylotrophus TaxID=3242694 RepID=A0ABV4TVL6_9GAMM
MAIRAPYLPIVYVRGYAARMDEIEDTVATPYMGFNLGATKLRQDHDGKPLRWIFESPLIRLMKDHGYMDAYADGDFLSEPGGAPVRSVWIFRYYEPVSESLGEGDRRTLPELAAHLRRFLLHTVRPAVCGDDPDLLADFRVHLVAHSMGGLLCRTYLQNLCHKGTGDPQRDEALELPGDPLVERVFTYATPHSGIDLEGVNVPDLGTWDKWHIRSFNRDVMRDYLDLPGGTERLDSLNGRFPPERFFCLVGTNYKDYRAFHGLSARATGPMSDGLVMIRNATVRDAPRAFVHRSHSGDYGIVNSEEGYQNLRRFLFGEVRVDARLHAEEITLPRPVQEKKDAGHAVRASYHIDSAVSLRNATCFLHERRSEHGSALLKSYDAWVKEGRPAYLFSGFLMRAGKGRDQGDTALAFALHVAVRVPVYEVDNRFWLDGHFEGGPVLQDTVTVHVRPDGRKTTIAYGLASRDGLGEARRRAGVQWETEQTARVRFPLGFAEDQRRVKRPGFRGHLAIDVHVR